MTELVDIDFSVEEDALIQGLLDARNKNVEVIAFGIFYSGVLADIDVDHGIITITDGEDRAVIEIERVESFSIVMP
ncbi:MAG TPA: hypothetical protein PKU96_06130 [bacterium]|nr:hypothetical protein [Myxococcales bacterium]OQA62337.1 MAG: hypothetical protein BWY40_00068 [bacterium ADurb.Bin270]HPW45928.1 hypothetical protein [bacterium]HQG12966.1 hypothetical protein [bacterium]HQH80496.1 hypothetical protein [bacterium]